MSQREDIAAKQELSQQQASDLEATRAELERARADLERMSEEKDESKCEVDRLSSGELIYWIYNVLSYVVYPN